MNARRARPSGKPTPASRARTVLGVGLIAASLIAAGALMAAPLLSPRIPVDPDTACRTDAAPPRHTLVLIDATEPLAARHKRILADVAAKAQAAAPRHARLSIVAMNAEAPDEPHWLASLCSPGDGSDASIWFSNPDRLRARWREAFAAPLTEAAQRAGLRHDERTSPIRATLGFLARDPRFNDAPARTLILVSDLLEFTPRGVSLYDAEVRFDPARDLPARLDGVEVEIVLLDRPRHAAAQASAYQRYWAGWFDASGADVRAAP